MESSPKSNFNNSEDGLKEAISKIFYIKEKRIPFAYQETLANCGPLAITNGINALSGINSKFTVTKDFPQSPQGIRKLLAENQELRATIFNTAPSTEISKSNYALQSGHISNLIKKLD